MANSNVKLWVGIAFILIIIFSVVVVRYAFKVDPTTIEATKRTSDNAESTAVETNTVLDTDKELLTTLGGEESAPSDESESKDEQPAVTQSTERVDNRRDTETTTTTTVTTAAPENSKKEKAGQELDAAAAKLDQAKDKLDQANAALSDAKSARDKLQGDLDSAKDTLEEAKSNYDEGQAENYNKGIAGFFESIGAGDAVDAYNGSEYSSAAEPANKNDAASLETIRRSIELMNEANQLRANEGKPELKVSCKLMALAVLSNDAAAANGESANNTGLDEDLAFGYDDPFAAWYDGEKDDEGGNYQSLVNENYVVTGFGTSNKNGLVHNMLFADKEYDAGTVMSVSEFSEKFESYYSTAVKGKGYAEEEAEYNRIEKELNDAKSAVTSKEAEVSSASSAHGSAKTIYEQKLKAYQAL